MSVIGYVRRCTRCDIKMLVTPDYKHANYCNECLDEVISDAIAAADQAGDDDYPLGQVTA